MVAGALIINIVISLHWKAQFELLFKFFFIFLYNFLTALRTVSNTYLQVARAKSCANHLQHVGQLCATCRLPCGTKRQLLSFDRAEILFILALFYPLKPLTGGGGKETEVTGENPR